MSKTSPETLAKIRRLALQGKSAKEIGALIGKSAKAIRKLFVRYDLPHLPRGGQRGKKNHFYKRGWMIDKDGYKLILQNDHPESRNSGYVLEHRLVIEKHLERYLTKDEVVHHIDKNKLNNDISNLKVFSSNGKHLKEELIGKVPKWSKDGIHRIQEAVKKSASKRKGVSSHLW